MGQEKHPPGLKVLFFTEMWERFGFYSMLAMFVLYLRNPEQGFSISADEAASLYSNYLMLVYASPLIGGWIADKKLGYRNAVLLGGLVLMLGYVLLSIHSLAMVYAALVCLIIGNGFFKPNVSTMVGHLYPEGSRLKDRAYNIFYLGINIGAWMAPIAAEILVNGMDLDLGYIGLNSHLAIKGVGFNLAFLAAACGMIISITTLWVFRAYVQPPKEEEHLTSPTAALPASRAPSAMEAVPEGQRIRALLVIFAISIVFWMVFQQNGLTLTYWADDNTNWKVSGIISNSINPFWIITLTFPLVWFWGWLDRRGMEPSTPTKMAMGMFLAAVSFTILFLAAREGEGKPVGPERYAAGDFRINQRSLDNLQAEGVPADVLQKLETRNPDRTFVIKDKKFATDDKGSGEHKLTTALQELIGNEDTAKYLPLIEKQSYLFKVSPWWLILAYAVVTLGELMLSPMGLSLVSKVAPVRMRGLMMGGWFVATAIGNKLTMIGKYWDIWRQSTFFIVLAGMALVMAFVLFILLRSLKKAMPGV
jgi:POT family proton-dependent oligopeptide transporter